MTRTLLLLVVAGVVFGTLVSCAVNPPVRDYALARAAFQAAQDSEASRFAPGLWFKAEEAYKLAQKLFDDREFDRAKRAFDAARIAAEKAENAARLAQFESGSGKGAP